MASLHTEAPGLPPIVLIVEDDEDTCEMYKSALEMNGFVATAAGRMADALAFAADIRPDAVLTDISLGPSTGVDLARQLKSNPLTSHIPILAVTGWDPVPLQRMDRLFEDVLLKPVDPAELIGRLQSVVRRSDELRAKARRVCASIPDVLERSAGLLEKSSELREAYGQPAAASLSCPRCNQPLRWLERRQVARVPFDYYAPCENGCGLFCYDHARRAFVTLIG
jgi:DNA-binding response OmpR family regulator